MRRVIAVGDHRGVRRCSCRSAGAPRPGRGDGSRRAANGRGRLRSRAPRRRVESVYRALIGRSVAPMMPPSDVDALVARVPQWTGKHPVVRPLHGGITNRNYVVTVDGAEYVVRIPGERTELLGHRPGQRGRGRRSRRDARHRPTGAGRTPCVSARSSPNWSMATTSTPRRSPIGCPTWSSSCAASTTAVPWPGRSRSTASSSGTPATPRSTGSSRRRATTGCTSTADASRLRSPHTPMAPVPCHNDLLPAQRAVRS